MKSKMLGEFRRGGGSSENSTAAESSNLKRVLWFAESRYALYFYRWPYFDLTPYFNRRPRGEMEELMWVSLSELVSSPTTVKIKERILPLRSFWKCLKK